MDPVRNPYAPGAGQRPPELAGRDGELHGFEVMLNALRSSAVRRGWGTGKLEARPDQPLAHPLAAALHLAVRELAQPNRNEAEHVLGVIKSFAQR